MYKNRRYTVYVLWCVYRLLYFVQSKTIFDSLFGHFHLCWVRSDRHCFRRFTHKKETVRKNLTVSRWFYCTGDIIRIIPIRCMIHKKYSDGRPFKSHLNRISPEVWLFCIEAKMAIFSRKQCSSKKPHYAYIFCRFLKEMFCRLGASLRSAWESVRFASERSRVRIPLGPLLAAA